MSATQSSSGDQNQQYLSKRVMINGQFVTLYSANGVTWLSSPEDIPDTMARLDNTRISLTDEKAAEIEKDDKGDKKSDKGEKERQAAAPSPKLQGSQYRMKGPKPRPILRQGGKVVEGTPVEPVSASSVNIKGAVDTALPTVKLSPMEEGLRRGKIVAPIAQRRPGKPKVAPPPSKKVAAPTKVTPAPKGKSPVAPPAKLTKGAKLPVKAVGKAQKSAAAPKVAPVKSVKQAAAPKKVAKPAKVTKKVTAKKPAPKKVVAKKSTAKSTAKSGVKKRSR